MTVHLLKNIWNSLLNRKKFLFPAFTFEIYDKDNILDAKLCKASKLTFKAMYPSNNKQNVNLAIAIFHETTSAACESYFSDRTDMSNFLNIMLVDNSKFKKGRKKKSNFLNTEAILNGKVDFYKRISDWVESWVQISDFCLTKKTFKAFVVILRAQAMLMQELLEEGYEYVFTHRLQSDPLENRFSQYQQMSGGRFLVSLCEVLSTVGLLQKRKHQLLGRAQTSSK